MQTWCNFEQDVIDTAKVQVTSGMLMADMSNTCSEMNFHLYGSSEHFTKLKMQFEADNGYFVVNIKGEFGFMCIFGVLTFTK